MSVTGILKPGGSGPRTGTHGNEPSPVRQP